MNHLVAPSLLSADFSHLANDLEMINRSEADWLHLDIMDGVFVPNISFGFPVLKHVAAICTKPLDVHLMIVNPEKFIDEVKALGATMMNVHYEACLHLHRVVGQIHEAGMRAGVTLNPSTPVAMLVDMIRDVDMVLLMAVNPFVLGDVLAGEAGRPPQSGGGPIPCHRVGSAGFLQREAWRECRAEALPRSFRVLPRRAGELLRLPWG